MKIEAFDYVILDKGSRPCLSSGFIIKCIARSCLNDQVNGVFATYHKQDLIGVFLKCNTEILSLKYKKISNLAVVDDLRIISLHDIAIVFICSPLERQITLPQGYGRCFIVSFCGWIDSQWCDGPLIETYDSAITNALPACGPASMRLSTMTSTISSYSDDFLFYSPEAIRLSVVHSIRSVWLSVKDEKIFLPAMNEYAILSLVLLKQASSIREVCVLKEPPKNIKRLLKNLHICHIVDSTSENYIDTTYFLKSFSRDFFRTITIDEEFLLYKYLI